ncbi:MAG: hypothetical protein JXR60_08220 [Bacteroidales bacterium]|nr:hypothetical protein [Bacteroidales bacterium]
MKKLTVALLFVFFTLNVFAQNFEQNILPDSLKIRNGKEFCSNNNSVHAIVYSSSYIGGPFYYLKIFDGNYEFIENIPYEIGYNKTYGMEIINNDCYHLTKSNGVQIYRQNGTWDSITVDNGLHYGYVQGIF